MKKLPKEIYVRYDGDAPDEFLNASDNIDEHADMGESRVVGVYALTKVVTVTGKAVVEERRRK